MFNSIRSNQKLHKQQLELFQRESISPAELEEIKELDRLEWEDDVREQIIKDIVEKKIQEERINFARNLLDVLDDKTIANKLELDIDIIKSLRI